MVAFKDKGHIVAASSCQVERGSEATRLAAELNQIKASLEARASSDATKFMPFLFLLGTSFLQGSRKGQVASQCQQGAIGNGR